MFYFKITVRRKRGETKFSTNYFREFLHLDDLGVFVAAQMRRREVTSVAVTRITQGAYLRKAG